MGRRLSSTLAVLASLFAWGCSSQTDSMVGSGVFNSSTPENLIFQFETTRSTPIAVSPKPSVVSPKAPSQSLLWCVNPDNDSVSVFDISDDTNQKMLEIPVGDNPQSLAIHGGGGSVYVVNQGSHSVSVIQGAQRTVTTIPNIGPNPYGAALTPDGKFLYVTGSTSGTVTKIDTSTQGVVQVLNLDSQFQEPVDMRGIAVTPDGKKVVVTTFLALPSTQGLAGRRVEGFDSGKSGYALILDVGDGANDQVGGVVELPPLQSGFTADRSAFCQDPNEPSTYCGGTAEPVLTFPNLLQSVTIVGSKVYLPSLGSSPEPPVRFNSNVQGLLSCIDLSNGNQVTTVNLNEAVPLESTQAGQPLNKVFFSAPWAIDFRPQGHGYLAVQGGNMVVKVNPTTLQPVTRGNGSIVRIPVGKDPRGIVIAPDSTRAYVHNYISRDISVLNLETDEVLATLPSAALPQSGTPEAQVHLGQELFNSSLGSIASDPNDVSSSRFAMSENGWGSCFNCHPFGLSDGVTWIFPNGPRQTIPLDGTFSGTGAADQRVLNWSAVRSTVQDFEKNTENVSGGFGLIGPFGSGDGVVDHGANRGLDPRADAIESYLTTIPAPQSPLDPNEPTAVTGRQVYLEENCNACHVGSGWTSSQVNYSLPATSSPGVTIFDGQILSSNGLTVLQDTGSFDPNSPIEVRGAGPQIGQTAQGALGFNVPSLLGAHAHGPYFHDGRFRTLRQVVESGHGQRTALNADKKSSLTAFLESLDERTAPVSTPSVRLTVANTLGNSIATFASAQSLTGSPNPTTEIVGPSTTLQQPFHLAPVAADPNDPSFWVANNQSQALSRFNSNGSGDVIPTSIGGPLTQITGPAGIAYDLGRDMLYNVNQGSTINVFHQASQRSGNTPPDRRLTGTPNLFGLGLDSLGDRLYCSRPGPGQIAVFDQASTLTGVAPVSRSFGATGLASPAGLFLDPVRKRLYVADQNSARIFVFLNPERATGTATPVAILGGGSTGFVFPRNVAIDTFRDQLYVLDFSANSVSVFNNASILRGNVNVAPNRVLQGGATRLNGPGGLLLLYQ